MKKILVPVDFSDKSNHAVKLAAKIGEKSDSTIYLLHLVELPSGVVDMGAGSNFSIPESMMYLKKVKEKILHLKETFFSKNTSVKYSIRFQQPYEGIMEYSKKIEADLIIMGAKGVSDFEAMIIGSNTEKLVRTSNVPVIVAKTNTENFSFENIIFASDFKDESKVSFQKLLDFCGNFQSTIHLLMVNTIDQFESTKTINSKINMFIEDFELSNYTVNIYNDKTIVQGIVNFAEDINADLIALSTHERSGLSKLFNDSIAQSLSKKATRPLITFKLK